MTNITTAISGRDEREDSSQHNDIMDNSLEYRQQEFPLDRLAGDGGVKHKICVADNQRHI